MKCRPEGEKGYCHQQTARGEKKSNLQQRKEKRHFPRKKKSFVKRKKKCLEKNGIWEKESNTKKAGSLREKGRRARHPPKKKRSRLRKETLLQASIREGEKGTRSPSTKTRVQHGHKRKTYPDLKIGTKGRITRKEHLKKKRRFRIGEEQRGGKILEQRRNSRGKQGRRGRREKGDMSFRRRRIHRGREKGGRKADCIVPGRERKYAKRERKGMTVGPDWKKKKGSNSLFLTRKKGTYSRRGRERTICPTSTEKSICPRKEMSQRKNARVQMERTAPRTTWSTTLRKKGETTRSSMKEERSGVSVNRGN